MSDCYYYKHRCNEKTRDHFAMCGSARCPPRPPLPEITTPKPAAPETREEEKTMPSPERCPTGTCPECKRTNVLLRATKYKPGERFCDRCCGKFSARAMAASKKEGEGSTAKAPAAPKAAKPAPSKAPEKIVEKRPLAAPPEPPPLPPQNVTDQGPVGIMIYLPADTTIAGLVAAFQVFGLRVSVSVGG